MSDFGQRLRDLRVEKGYTQKQLAERLSLTKAVISSYETNYRMPSYDVLLSIARVFGVTTDYLLGRDRKLMIDLSELDESDAKIIMLMVDRLRLKK